MQEILKKMNVTERTILKMNVVFLHAKHVGRSLNKNMDPKTTKANTKENPSLFQGFRPSP